MTFLTGCLLIAAAQARTAAESFAGLAGNVAQRERALEVAIERKVHRMLDDVLSPFGVAVLVRLNGDSRDQFEQDSVEERSFAIKTMERKLDGEAYVERDPHPTFRTMRRRWEPGSEIEHVSVAVLIAGPPLDPERTAKFEAIIRTIAGDDGSGRFHVHVTDIPPFRIDATNNRKTP